jgi:transposase-like protein
LNKVFRINVPRDRLGLFKPVFLELLKQEQEEISNLSFKLYSKGLTTRDIEEVFTELYGNKYSRSSISRITLEFSEERKKWQNRRLEERYYAIFIDALYLPVRRGTVEKEAVYVILGLREDLTRDVLSVWCMPNETAGCWEEMLKNIKARGVEKVLHFTADGLSGLPEAISRVFPDSNFQSCLIHKERNLLRNVRTSDKKQILHEFKMVFEIENEFKSIGECKLQLHEFVDKWAKKYPSIKKQFKETEVDKFFTYLKYPVVFRRMIYTTNWIENLNRKIKRTTKIRCSFPNEDSLLNLVCATLIDTCENNFYIYKISSLFSVKDKLDDLINRIGIVK